MNKSKNIFRFCLVGVFLIWLVITSGCTNKQTVKEQLSADAKATRLDIKNQKQNLKTIKQKLTQNQASFSDEQKQYPKQNLLTVQNSKTYRYVTARQKAYATFKKTQVNLKNDQTELTKISNQDYPNIPKQSIRNLTQSLHLSALDQKTLVTFMDELEDAETTYYELAAQTDIDKLTTDNPDEAEDSELMAQENRLNQYYGAVFQQIEIIDVNLNTVQKQARQLQQALK